MRPSRRANQPFASERPCAMPDRGQPRPARRTPPATPRKASANGRRPAPVAQPAQTFVIVAVHPIPQGLQVHPANPGRARSTPRLQELEPTPNSTRRRFHPFQPRPRRAAPLPSNPIAKSPPPCRSGSSTESAYRFKDLAIREPDRGVYSNGRWYYYRAEDLRFLDGWFQQSPDRLQIRRAKATAGRIAPS